MKLSQKSRDGIKVVALLAREENLNLFLSISDLSASTGITKPFLEKVISDLKKRDIVLSGRGKDGGYKLARPADNISIGEILRALENDLKITECATGECIKKCPSKDIFRNLYLHINSYLDSIKLSDITSKGD